MQPMTAIHDEAVCATYIEISLSLISFQLRVHVSSVLSLRCPQSVVRNRLKCSRALTEVHSPFGVGTGIGTGQQNDAVLLIGVSLFAFTFRLAFVCWQLSAGSARDMQKPCRPCRICGMVLWGPELIYVRRIRTANVLFTLQLNNNFVSWYCNYFLLTAAQIN